MGQVISIILSVHVILVQTHPAIHPLPKNVPSVIIQAHHARYLHTMEITVALWPIVGQVSSTILPVHVILVQQHPPFLLLPKNAPNVVNNVPIILQQEFVPKYNNKFLSHST